MANIIGLLVNTKITDPTIDFEFNQLFIVRGGLTTTPVENGDEDCSVKIIPYLNEDKYNADPELYISYIRAKYSSVSFIISEIEKVDNAFNFNNLIYTKIKEALELTNEWSVELVER